MIDRIIFCVKTSIRSFEIVREKTTDHPVKTQVEQHILVKDHIKPENLRALLNKQYKEIESRSGFNYHDKPTNVYLYVYDSMVRAKAEGFSWIASLQKSYGNSPNIKSQLISVT